MKNEKQLNLSSDDSESASSHEPGDRDTQSDEEMTTQEISDFAI